MIDNVEATLFPKRISFNFVGGGGGGGLYQEIEPCFNMLEYPFLDIRIIQSTVPLQQLFK